MRIFLTAGFIFAAAHFCGAIYAANESAGKIENGQTIRLPNGKKIVIKVNPQSPARSVKFGEIPRDNNEESSVKNAEEKKDAKDEAKAFGEQNDIAKESEKEKNKPAESEKILEEKKVSEKTSDDKKNVLEKSETIQAGEKDETKKPSIWDEVISSAKAELEKAYAANKLKPEFYYAQTPCFFLVSDIDEAIPVCRNILTECEAMIASYFYSRGEKLAFQRLIVVQVVSPEKLLRENPEFKGKFSVSIDDNGDISIVAKWSEELSLGEFCTLISGAMLRRICMDIHGTDKSKNIPYFLDLAFTSELERRLRPGFAQDLARLTIEENVPHLSQVMQFERGLGDIEKQASHSYWAIRALEAIAPSRAKFVAFMRGALLASNAKRLSSGVEKKWSIEMPDFESPENLDENTEKTVEQNEAKEQENSPSKEELLDAKNFYLYWACVVTGEKISRLGGVQSIKDSRLETLRLAVIQVSDEEGDRYGITDFNQLWEMREEKQIRSALRSRIIEIKVALTLSNPVYYNSLLALGKVFEAILNDDDSYASSFEDFKKECQHAYLTEDRVIKLMNVPSSDLKKLPLGE